MISSLIWIILIQIGYINSEQAPWKTYLPVCLVEIVIYFKLLTKWGEK